jgi:hypothetical protein
MSLDGAQRLVGHGLHGRQRVLHAVIELAHREPQPVLRPLVLVDLPLEATVRLPEALLADEPVVLGTLDRRALPAEHVRHEHGRDQRRRHRADVLHPEVRR